MKKRLRTAPIRDQVKPISVRFDQRGGPFPNSYIDAPEHWASGHLRLNRNDIAPVVSISKAPALGSTPSGTGAAMSPHLATLDAQQAERVRPNRATIEGSSSSRRICLG